MKDKNKTKAQLIVELEKMRQCVSELEHCETKGVRAGRVLADKEVEALHVSEEKYRELFNNSNDAIFLHDLDGVIVDINQKALNLFGYTKTKMLSLKIAELHPPEAMERSKWAFETITNKRFVNFEIEFKKKDGEIFSAEVSSSLFEINGVPMVQGIARDITERKQAEETIKQSHIRLLTVLDSIDADVYVSDMETFEILLINQHMQDSFGGNFIGQICWQAFRGESGPCPHCTNDQLLDANGKPAGVVTWEGKNPITKNWYINHDRAIEWVDGRLVRLQVATDITGMKQVEQDLEKSEERYRSFVQNFQGIAFLGRMDFTPLMFHGSVEGITGYTMDEFLAGKPRWDQVVHPDDMTVFSTDNAKKLHSVPNYLYERDYRIVRKDGQIRWVHEVIQNICDESGKPVMVQGEIYDITERKLAEEKIQGYFNNIEALLKIEKAITSTLNVDEVLSIIMMELEQVIPFDSISVQLLEGKSLEIVACRGFNQQDEVEGLVFPLTPEFPNKRVIEKSEALAIKDVAQEYPHFKNQSNKYKSGNIRSWLGVPLMSKGTVKGMIALDRNEVLPFSEDEIQLAVTFASQAGLAIENARLYSAANRRLERLSSLHQIDQNITSNMDLRITLDILLGHTRQQLKIDAAAILFYISELQSLEFAAGQGFHTKALQFTNLRLGEGHAGRAALERRTVLVPDLNQTQTGLLRSPEFREEKFFSYIGVPLIAKGYIIGVLEIYHRNPLDTNQEWMEFLETLAGQAAIAIDNIRLFDSMQSSNLQLRQAYDATIEGWARALELRDMETEGHSRRVVDLTLSLARKLGIDEGDLVQIRRGALLHDIGKMGVSDAILQKPGKLTDGEWRIVRQHPEFARKLLAPITFLKPALDIPCNHHEKWNGTGYPQGLQGEQIPLPARIFSVVDVWDALLSDRPYRKPWSKKEALAHLREQSGLSFDPDVVKAFIDLLSERGILT